MPFYTPPLIRATNRKKWVFKNTVDTKVSSLHQTYSTTQLADKNGQRFRMEKHNRRTNYTAEITTTYIPINKTQWNEEPQPGGFKLMSRPRCSKSGSPIRHTSQRSCTTRFQAAHRRWRIVVLSTDPNWAALTLPIQLALFLLRLPPHEQGSFQTLSSRTTIARTRASSLSWWKFFHHVDINTSADMF